MHSGCGERLVGLGPPRRTRRQVHERLGGQPGEVDLGLTGKRMVGGDHGHQPVVRQPPGDHPFGPGGHRKSEKSDVDSALLDLVDELFAATDAQPDADVRIPLVKGVKRGRDVDSRDGRDHADGESTPDLPDRRGDLGGGPLGRVQALTGRREERLTGRGHPHPTARPVEKAGAEFPFQAGDLMAERGLHDQTPLGGTGEVPRLGDRHHVPQLLKLHPSIVDHD
ncbi:hypothetical protein GCM10029963_08020 [Micromonospora andamanensis]